MTTSPETELGRGPGPFASIESLAETQRQARRIVEAFQHADPAAVDAAIDEALGRLGETLVVDRTYTFAFRGESSDNTHEWCAPGISPEIDNLQGVPNEAIASWLDPLARGEHIFIPDVESLPADRIAEREILEPQGILSLLVVPLISFGRLRGFVGFDSVRHHRHFTDAEIEVLRSVADAINAAEIRRDAEADVARAERRLIALTRHATDLIAVFDDDGTITFASSSWEQFGLDVGATIGSHWNELVHADDTSRMRQVLAEIVRGDHIGTPVPLPDLRLVNDATRPRWLSGTVTDLRHEAAVGGYVLNAHEITARKEAEERLAHDALHDPLTGLGNRTQFADRLALACRRSARTGSGLAVLFLDLDRFKLINDGNGHAVGDELLCAVGRRIVDAVRSTDSVARFGGDEFLVLLEDIHAEEAQVVTHAIRTAIARPIVIGGSTYRVTTSIGAAVAAGAGLDAETLIRDADTAMYQAKERGRDRVAMFDPDLHRTVLRRMELVHRLPSALDDERIEVHYQPVVDLQSGRLLGAEALARWHDPDLGWVPPGEFVGVAEEIGLVDRLGDLVLSQALAEATTWPSDLHVAVNLSPAQLVRTDLAREVDYRLRHARIAADRLCLEITESMLMVDPGSAIETLDALRRLGVRTALDDFGTGFSSLAMLREIPVDVLKIDRSFVKGVDSEDHDRRLVDAVIGLADDFGMQALAEGVETEAQQLELLAAGCRVAQGYLFGKPMPAKELRERIVRRR